MQTVIAFLEEMILPYPKSILLFLIGIVNICWITYTIFLQKNHRKKIYRAYLLFAFFVFLWVWGNAWAFSRLFVSFGAAGLIYTFLFVSLATTFAITVFFYISCLLKSRSGIISLPAKVFIILMVLQNLVLNLMPGLVIEHAEVFPDGTFALVQTPYNSILYLFSIIAIFWSWTNVILALRRSARERQQIEKMKFIYICIGISIMYGSSIIFHQILPYLFQIYSYAWVPPALSVFDVLIVGYGVVVQRFPDLKFIASRLAKRLGAFGIAAGFVILFYLALQKAFPETPPWAMNLLTSMILIYSYISILRFFHSATFHHFIGTTGTEFFLRTLQNFRRKNVVYNDLQHLEKDLRVNFEQKLQLHKVRLIVLDAPKKKKYPGLMKYFQKHNDILVTKEIQFLERSGQQFPFAKELKSLGEICLPLFHPPGVLIGFFVLGSKPFDNLYSKEEIEALENLGPFLSLELKSVLYSSHLQKEVARKTADLQNLIRQQSDFMALSTHEIRTPLNVAMFQLEDTLESHRHRAVVRTEIETAISALADLKELTDRLFEFQQYELDKIKIVPQKTALRPLLQRICESFEPVMEEKSFDFRFQDELKKDCQLALDVALFKQVLNNLLGNAMKFTKPGGKIRVLLREDKQYIFILVQDNGRGIPLESQEKVFEKFQTTNVSMGMGLGLGLHICRKIITFHHGKIRIEDTPGGGTTVLIRLPK